MDLMIPDTILGGKIATLGEVFNGKKASFIYSRVQRESAALVLDHGYSIAEANRSIGVNDNILRRLISQLKQERGGHILAAKNTYA